MERTTCLDDGECVLADDQVDVKFNAASTALASTHDFKHAKVSKTGSGDIADLLQQLQGALPDMSLKTESSPELAVADSAQCPPVQDEDDDAELNLCDAWVSKVHQQFTPSAAAGGSSTKTAKVSKKGSFSSDHSKAKPLCLLRCILLRCNLSLLPCSRHVACDCHLACVSVAACSSACPSVIQCWPEG